MSPTPATCQKPHRRTGILRPVYSAARDFGRDCYFSEGWPRASNGGLSARYGQHRPIEFVVEPDANNVGREPDILSKNRGGRPWEPGNGVVIAAAQRPLPTDSSAIMRRAAVLGCAAVCAGLFLVTIKVGSLSLFRIFYALVPGAAAIRAGCRAMIVANLFAVIAIALGCAGARPPLSRHRFGFPASLGLALLALAVVEQINFAPTAQLSRAFDIARLQHVQAAPSSCRSFYVSDERKRQPYEVQIDAMLVALERERPTINGYSGLFPPGWDLFDTKDAAYEQHVAAWIASRKLEGVCRVDVEAGTWTSSQ